MGLCGIHIRANNSFDRQWYMAECTFTSCRLPVLIFTNTSDFNFYCCLAEIYFILSEVLCQLKSLCSNCIAQSTGQMEPHMDIYLMFFGCLYSICHFKNNN